MHLTHKLPIVARAFGNWGRWRGLRGKRGLRRKGDCAGFDLISLAFQQDGHAKC